MATQVFPVSVSSTGPNAWSISATTSGVVYEGTQAFTTGTYTVTCSSSTVTKIEFFTGNTSILQTQTASGTVTFNLTTAATKVKVWTNTGSNIVVSFALTANVVSSSATTLGTLETLTTSGTYTGTSTSGYALVVVVGAGAGGGAARSANSSECGGGGGSGGVTSATIALTGSVSYTIGSAGNGGATSDANGNAGGSTTFGSLTANGGGAGRGEGIQLGGAAGTPGGAAGSTGSPTVTGNAVLGTATSSPFYSIVQSGTTGSGAGGTRSFTYNGSGAGSGIGTGGYRIDYTESSPTGYGAGGGGGNPVLLAGQAGRPGVVYLMRY